MDTEKLILHIAGLGAVGSHLVNQIMHHNYLSKFLDIRGWDFDKVEMHNCGNQYFSYADVGKYKADAISQRFPSVLTASTAYIPSPDTPCDILVLAVDTMASRRSIYWDSFPWFYLDTRLAENAIVSLTGETLEANLDYDDEEAQVSSPCQSGFHADKELVLQSVAWLIEQLESIVNDKRYAFNERRLIGGETIEWGDTNGSTN